MIFIENSQLTSVTNEVELTEDLINTLNESLNFKEIKNKLSQRISNMWKSFLEWLKGIGEKIKRLIEKVKARFSKKGKIEVDKKDDEKEEKIDNENKSSDFNNDQQKVINELNNFIEKKDINHIKATLNNNLLWYGNDIKFLKQCVNIVNQKLPKVFVPISDKQEKKIINDKEYWNKDYFYYLLSESTLSEYSLEFYNHMVNVCNYIKTNKNGTKDYRDYHKQIEQNEKSELEKTKTKEEEKDTKNKFSEQEMKILNVEKFLLDTKNDILNKNLKPIKRAILLLIDKDAADINNELKNYVKLVEKYIPNIWDTHKELEKPKSKDQWNENYLGLLQADLKYNFSKKRLNFLIEVAKYVYKNENYATEEKNKNQQKEELKRQEKEKKQREEDDKLKSNFTEEELKILESDKILSRTKNSLLNKEARPIKRAIFSIAIDNPNILNDYLKICQKYVNVWEKHKDLGEKLSKEEWNEDYLEEILYRSFLKNSSKERLNHILEVSKYVNSGKSESFIFILENVLLEDIQKVIISKKALPISSQKIRAILSEIKNPRNIDSIEKNNELIKKLNAEFEKFNSINDKIAVDNTFILNNLQKLSNELNVHSKNLEALYKMNVNSISKNDNNELLMSKIRLLNKAIVIVKDLFEICINSTVKNN